MFTLIFNLTTAFSPCIVYNACVVYVCVPVCVCVRVYCCRNPSSPFIKHGAFLVFLIFFSNVLFFSPTHLNLSFFVLILFLHSSSFSFLFSSSLPRYQFCASFLPFSSLYGYRGLLYFIFCCFLGQNLVFCEFSLYVAASLSSLTVTQGNERKRPIHFTDAN